MVIKRGDIYFADLSSGIGFEIGGVRPVLVVQNDIANKHSPSIIVASITSRRAKVLLPIQVILLGDKYGLTRDSVILLDQIRTIDKSRLKNKITTLDQEIMEQVSKAWMISGGIVDLEDKLEKENIQDYYKFIIDNTVDIFEDYEYEFKEIKGVELNPINTINSTIAEYAASFLNSKGGRIYYGISDDRRVIGVKSIPNKKDEINRIIYSNLANINPPISPDYFEIIYHPVFNRSNEIIEDLYVIEVVTPLSYDKNMIYFVNGNNLFVRVKGVKKKLLGNEIVSYIRKRLLEDIF